MISCKEDLVNTYIKNDFGELRDLYVKFCERFGISKFAVCKLNMNYMAVYSCDHGIRDPWGLIDVHCDNDVVGMNKLTIDDLKPKRTKVEYEQLGFHKCHEAMFKHEMEERLYIGCNGGFELATHVDIADNWNYNLYRRIETEIDERQEFIDEAYHASQFSKSPDVEDVAAAMFDSGKFKLVTD